MTADSIVRFLQELATAVTPWLVFAVVVLLVVWFVLLCRQNGVFARCVSRFNALAPLSRVAAVAAVCLFAMWGGSKEGGDRGGTDFGCESGGMRSGVVSAWMANPPVGAVTNLCFTAISPAETSVFVSAVWPVEWMVPALSVYARRDLAGGGWEKVADAIVPTGASAVDIEIPHAVMPEGAEPRAFFALGTYDDTDGDGIPDADELLVYGTDPARTDTDGDGMTDAYELSVDTDPLSSDTDGDGMSDGDEIAAGTNPLSSDSDSDRLSDKEELGCWEYVGSLPVFDVSSGTNLLVSTKSYFSNLFVVPLPFEVMCAGVLHTNVTIGVNGLVGLMCAGSAEPFSASDINHDLHSYSLSMCHTGIAAYWDDLYAAKNGGSRITVADVETNGQRYCVIEYSRIQQYSFRTNTAERGTFQIVIPHDEPNVVYVHYIDMSPAFDGSSATIGAQLPKRLRNFAISHNAAGAVTNGMVLAYRFGSGTDPLEPDTDGDGLDDGMEVPLGTCPWKFDTDGDGLGDGWEVLHGLDPFSSSGEDGADGDPDGDTLCNLKEHEYDTNPTIPDTDGDGLSDAEETGSIAICDGLPWLQFDLATNVTQLLMDSANRCITHTLPFALQVQHEMVTNVTVSYNGMLMLDRAGCANGGMSNSHLSFTVAVCHNALLLAPYLDYFRFYTNVQDRASAVSIGTATHDGTGYLLLEWRDMYRLLLSQTTNAISFQVAIPTNQADHAYVRYRDVTGWAMDGRNGCIGMQTFGGERIHAYCHQKEGSVWEGLALKFAFGASTDPLNPDTDLDGIEDGIEISIGTDPNQSDSDGDGMHDGWEFLYGFDPAMHNGQTPREDDDGTADPDGDGMNNAEECQWGTNPSGSDEDEDGQPDGYDTDGDGVSDGAEVGQNSDPSDATDGGATGSRVSVSFYFGDHSDSHSEKYILDVTPESGCGSPPRAYSWLNAKYGQCETKEAKLKPGWRYEVSLRHSSTDSRYVGPPTPDYDYTLQLDMDNLPPNVSHSDPSGLFGVDTTSTEFSGDGKVAYVNVHAVTNVSICKPDGNAWEELVPGRVVLDDEVLRVKVEIYPKVATLDRCRRMFGNAIVVRTSGTCPDGASIPIGDDAAIDNTSGHTEIRISKTRDRLKSLGLLPQNDNDGVNEMAWLDMGSTDPTQPSNLTDSEAFSSLNYEFRGKATQDATKTLDSMPPNSVPSESFFKAAGCEVVTAEYCGVKSAKRQIMNQADYFYYSGHGYHLYKTVFPDFAPELVGGYWNKDLQCVIFSACSILDINDYNNNFRWNPQEHNMSPGKTWETVGPSILLGYNYYAPSDNTGAPAQIIASWIQNRSVTNDIEAWMLANRASKKWNACAIQKGTKYVYFENLPFGIHIKREVNKEDW